MNGHVFIDQTKQHGYPLAASAVTADALDVLRKTIRSLILPGQRRWHMKYENDHRKHAITSTITATDIQAIIYDAARRYRLDAGLKLRRWPTGEVSPQLPRPRRCR